MTERETERDTERMRYNECDWMTDTQWERMTEWGREEKNETSAVGFVLRRSQPPQFRQTLGIMWSSAWKRGSGIRGLGPVSARPVEKQWFARLLIYIVISPANASCVRQRHKYLVAWKQSKSLVLPTEHETDGKTQGTAKINISMEI